MSFRFLICGVGSIGERHLRNLRTLGHHDIALYRTRNLPLRTVKETYPVYLDLDEALQKHQPDVCIICSPTHLHLNTALKCAETSHLLIEKPLSHTLEGVSELQNILDQSGKQAMVGYMMRFHPALIRIKELLKKERLGKVCHVRSFWGEYLPDWHPWEDYRETYAARADMGGGPCLTLSHEFDVLFWLFGESTEVIAMSNNASDLELTTEHGIDILCRLPSGATAHTHLNYFQRPPKRFLEISGTEATLAFDYYKSELKVMLPGQAPIIEKWDDFDRNDLFISELSYFLECVSKKESPRPSIADGAAVMTTALTALKKSR